MQIQMSYRHLYYLLCSALLTVGEIQSQDTLLFVDFQNNFLDPLVTIDNDMLPLDPTFQGLGGGFSTVPVNGPNDIRAIGVSSFLGGGTADNWLITPVVEVPDQGATLSWIANSLSGEDTRLESYSVWISTSGNELMNFTELAVEITDESPSQMLREISLEAYAGRAIHIGYQQNGTDKFALALDDILVMRKASGFSAELSSLRCPRYQDISDISFEVVISNTGTETITELMLQLEESGNPLEQFSLTNLTLNPNESDAFVFNPMFLGNAERIDFDIRLLTNQGTEVGFSPNHTLIPIMNPEERTIFVEEATSTACGWCPEGLTEKLFINFLIPEAIVVSVHDQDPMESLVASIGLENIDGFAGYPSLAVNRLGSALPGEVINFVNNEFGPVAVSPTILDFTNTYDPVARQLVVQFEAEALTRMGADDYRFGLYVIENQIRGTSPDFAQANNFSQDAFDVPLVGVDGVDWQRSPDPFPQEQIIYNDVVRDVVGGFDGIIGSFETLNLGESTSFEVDYILPSVFVERNITLVAFVIDAESGEVVAAKEDFLNFVSATSQELSNIEVEIYPNPASKNLYLNAKGVSNEKYIIEIYNMASQLVLEKSLESIGGRMDKELDVEGLQSGNYTLIIRTLDGVLARRISIVK